MSSNSGIAEVRTQIKDEWKEITTIGRREVLSELPDTVDRFVDELQSGIVPVDALRELGGIQSCRRCGTEILRPELAAEAILEYYGSPELDVDLEALLAGEHEVESVDVNGVCSYCAHQILKND